MILSLTPSFPHSSSCSPHYSFFWARDLPKAYHLCPAFSLAVQDEEPDMGQIPQNTLNINEMTTYCSAQKQGKDVSLQDPQHKHTHKCLQFLAHLLKQSRNVLRGTCTAAATSDQPGCANLGREAPAKPGSESPESFGPSLKTYCFWCSKKTWTQHPPG